MPDLADIDAALRQLSPRTLKIRDNQVQAPHGARLGVGETHSDLHRARGARRRQLYDTEIGTGPVIHVQVETRTHSV